VGELTYREIRTGMVYGFLRDIVALQDQFRTTDVLFCFDDGHSMRRQFCPSYKTKRKQAHAKLTEEERKHKDEFYKQLDHLRDDYLPGLGYNNVFHCPGYEGDDVIASLLNTLPERDDKVVVTADADLLQCLATPQTTTYNPRTRVVHTAASFTKLWGLEPDQWPDVKALAGCITDDIPGIRGVGESTAAKYLRGELCTTHKIYATIHSPAGHKVWRDNLAIVRLPFAGCPVFTPTPDAVTAARWDAFSVEYGMTSLRGVVPQAGRAGKVRNGQGFGLRKGDLHTT
jgi:5'-3' exonuclease